MIINECIIGCTSAHTLSEYHIRKSIPIKLMIHVYHFTVAYFELCYLETLTTMRGAMV